jgi:hypothetical protein
MDRRIVALCFAALLGTACSNSGSSRTRDEVDASTPGRDAGSGRRDAEVVQEDASTEPGEDAEAPASALPRPGLERPPTRLPADLRPPR